MGWKSFWTSALTWRLLFILYLIFIYFPSEDFFLFCLALHYYERNTLSLSNAHWFKWKGRGCCGWMGASADGSFDKHSWDAGNFLNAATLPGLKSSTGSEAIVYHSQFQEVINVYDFWGRLLINLPSIFCTNPTHVWLASNVVPWWCCVFSFIHWFTCLTTHCSIHDVSFWDVPVLLKS